MKIPAQSKTTSVRHTVGGIARRVGASMPGRRHGGKNSKRKSSGMKKPPKSY